MRDALRAPTHYDNFSLKCDDQGTTPSERLVPAHVPIRSSDVLLGETLVTLALVGLYRGALGSKVSCCSTARFLGSRVAAFRPDDDAPQQASCLSNDSVVAPTRRPKRELCSPIMATLVFWSLGAPRLPPLKSFFMLQNKRASTTTTTRIKRKEPKQPLVPKWASTEPVEKRWQPLK